MVLLANWHCCRQFVEFIPIDAEDQHQGRSYRRINDTGPSSSYRDSNIQRAIIAEPYFPQLTGMKIADYQEYVTKCCPSDSFPYKHHNQKLSRGISDERRSHAVGK
ncbi:hypothetical protein TNCV_1485371 [Trichonephila clavipes]|nr:hypothetical protein TNCV_1485371 [Trichonephila clavipes]